MRTAPRYAASLVLTVVGLLFFGACGVSSGANDRVNTPTNTDAGDVSAGGPFQWTRATTDDGERVLTIDFVGGAEYEPANSCTVRYATTVTETDQSVTVLVSGWSPPPPTPTSLPYECPLLGYPRSVTVNVNEPLGTLILINAATGEAHPVNVEPWTPPTSTSPPASTSDSP